MALVLTKAELERMRQSVQDRPADYLAREKRAQLKQLSEDRVKHWPNTLEALRKKKENFAKERSEQEELKRQEIDKQEAEVRRAARLEAIRKANEMLYEQTDKMKMLRSQQLYADVIYERTHQMETKKKVKEIQKEEERHHHEHILQTVAHLEQQEKEKIDHQKRLIEEVKKSREEQLNQVKTKRNNEKQKIIDDGLRMKREAQERLQEEIQSHELRQQMISESNAKMVIANEELKKVKDEIRYKEQLDELEREQEILKIDNRKETLKQLEKQRFNKAQLQRQKLIDNAIKLLSEKSNKEEKLLEQQMQDLKDKEDRLLYEKKLRNDKFRDDISKSRIEQINARELLERQRYEEEGKLLEKWKKENEEAMEMEIQKQKNLRLETIKLKKSQYDDGLEIARRRKEEKMLEIEQAKFLHSIRGNDDARFIELTKQEIERNVIMGKPVYTLLKALEYSQPALLPAKTVKVSKEKDADK